ncbi:D-alanyl-D-alanine carboxypeptidase [Lentilactobacillus sp. IMAU92037]|uniref:D-alanyl-D-alanine carboxypeptidase family protein n=1 Tax=Lentilactobacillus TaxID=2767893 RepID=UPI001C27378D|nr:MULTISPECIES: D-alanyl-D-alanine carboxypeptidase family protein [Lentilactobacillus]MBU9789665.1 D-alanyl-D-alanine carboxypeptidase [Lentilactobacillus dabitei]MBV0931021.1 D-alanyl-D-alanine carboxypeptidase [Lentilactobacillus dabitei]MDM7516715.1 D-alanyl-D-alanine carboxypeptidase family protein [Lentilactobacillus sp. TOM.63]
MNLRFKAIIALIGTFLLSAGFATGVQASSVTDQPAIAAKAAIAVDARTGQILYQKNAHQALPIASVSKLMTIYIVHQQIKQKKLAWDDQVTISPALAKLSTASGLTNVPLTAGKSYSVRQLVNATLVASANAAALALGQKVAGTPVKFAKLMNQTAKQIGIKDAKFYNASGLTNKLTGGLALANVSGDAENELSASDVALLASKLIKAFPRVTEITKKTVSTFYGTAITGHNQLLNDHQIAKGVVVDGLKTGTSDKAGACFVGSATRKHHRIITVVLGSRNKSATDPARFIQTAKLMRYVFTDQHPITLSKGSQIKGVGKAAVPDGKQVDVQPVVKQTTWVWTPKNISKQQVQGKYVHLNQKIAAPAKKGTAAGKTQLTYGQVLPKYLQADEAKVQLVTNKSIKKANPFILLWRAILRLF